MGTKGTSKLQYSPELKKRIDNCPLCEKKDLVLFKQITFTKIPINYFFCKDCGLVFQNPQMSEEEKKKYYASDYRLHMFGQAEPPKVDLGIQNDRANHLVTIVQNHISIPNNTIHVDIGCGSGALIKRFQESCGTISSGVEPDNAYRHFCEIQGFTVYPSLDEWKMTLGSRAGLVTISHVLEHISDPVKFLFEIRNEVLNASGYLLIEVPNLYFHESFELAHVIGFSPKTLISTLSRAGFDIVFLKAHGIPGYLTPRYITVLAKVNDHYKISPSHARVLVVEKTRRSFGIGTSRFENFLRKVTRYSKRALRKF